VHLVLVHPNPSSLISLTFSGEAIFEFSNLTIPALGHFFMSDLQEEILFKGIDGQECELFIHAIRKRALAEGKQRDDEWMADVAAACLIEDALRWFETLDEEVQGSWKRLRPALLSQYPKPETRRGSVRPTSNSDGVIPTPAAAPPLPAPINSSPPEIRGRLKYVARGGLSPQGWIRRTPESGVCALTESSAEALQVRYLRDLRRLETVNAEIATQGWLGHGTFSSYDVLKFVEVNGAAKADPMKWDVSPDNSVTLRIGQDGMSQEVKIYVRRPGHVIALSQPASHDYSAARLTIEAV